MRLLASFLLVTLGALAGCGATPSTGYDPSGYEDGPAITRGTIDMPTSEAGRPDQDAIDALIAMQKAQRALRGLACTATVFAKGETGDARTTFAASWTLDGAALEATESTYPAWKKGLKIAFDAKGATLRFPGLRGWLPASKRSLLDKALLDARGNGLVAMAPAATVERLAGTGLGEVVGASRIENAAVTLIAIPRGPGFDPAITREVLAIETATGLLRRHQMYAGAGLVYEQTLTKLSVTR